MAFHVCVKQWASLWLVFTFMVFFVFKKHFLVFDVWISYQKYISTVEQCGDIF